MGTCGSASNAMEMSDQGREDRHLIDIGAASGLQRASSANMLTGNADGAAEAHRSPGRWCAERRGGAVWRWGVSELRAETPLGGENGRSSILNNWLAVDLSSGGKGGFPNWPRTGRSSRSVLGAD